MIAEPAPHHLALGCRPLRLSKYIKSTFEKDPFQTLF
jgi:hypothetical protein